MIGYEGILHNWSKTGWGTTYTLIKSSKGSETAQRLNQWVHDFEQRQAGKQRISNGIVRVKNKTFVIKSLRQVS